MSLIDKLKKSRQTSIEIAGKTFTITRPTPMEAMTWLTGTDGEQLSPDKTKAFFEDKFSLNDDTWRKIAQAALEQFVVDWSGFTELDFYPGGTGMAVPFDRDLFLEWVKDHPVTVTSLGYHIFDLWLQYLYLRDDDIKKQTPGSTPEMQQDLSASSPAQPVQV